MAGGLLEEVGCTRVLEGRHTIPAIIKELSLQRTLENGLVLTDAQGIILSDELAANLQTDPQGLTVLTALHNTHEHEKSWKNSIKSSPVEDLKSPCITLLAASNEVLFNEIVKGRDMEGGFIARTFIVHESRRARNNPLTRRPIGLRSTKDLSGRLKAISKIKGEFQWTEEAIDTYETWYEEISNHETSDRTGSMERLGDQALKAAMLISLADREDLKITRKDLMSAISYSEECIVGTHKISLGTGRSEIAGAQGDVIKMFLKAPNHIVQKAKVLRDLWPHIDVNVLDKIIDSLTQAGDIDSFIGETKDGKRLGLVYKMSAEAALRHNGNGKVQ